MNDEEGGEKTHKMQCLIYSIASTTSFNVLHECNKSMWCCMQCKPKKKYQPQKYVFFHEGSDMGRGQSEMWQALA